MSKRNTIDNCKKGKTIETNFLNRWNRNPDYPLGEEKKNKRERVLQVHSQTNIHTPYSNSGSCKEMPSNNINSNTHKEINTQR